MTFELNQKLRYWARRPRIWRNEKTGYESVKAKGSYFDCYFVNMVSEHSAMVAREIGTVPRSVRIKNLEVL